MNRILVGVDGSANSEAAAAFAAFLARSTGTKLQLACAIESTAPYGVTASRAVADAQAIAARKVADDSLAHAAAALRADGTDVETIAVEGPAAEALAKLATGDVGLVVVGHRSRSSLARATLGSVADRLVQISSKPVMVFK